jgi:hypothetical protein
MEQSTVATRANSGGALLYMRASLVLESLGQDNGLE